MYSAVVVFVHPAQVLSSIENAVDFYELQCKLILQGGHSSSWCILCKLPHYETSRYFPAIPHQPFLALPITPDAEPQLCLDSTSCDADCMLIQMLHHIRRHNTDNAMMPPAFRTSLMLPWEIRMEEYPKLWENEVFMMWKAGFLGVDVSLAINFVGTCHTEYDAQRIILDISNGTIIHYPAAQVDEEDVGNSTGEIPDDNDDDDDDVDKDNQQTATEISTKSDDSGFHSSGVGGYQDRCTHGSWSRMDWGDALLSGDGPRPSALIVECTLHPAMLKPLGRASTPSSSTMLLALA